MNRLVLYLVIALAVVGLIMVVGGVLFKNYTAAAVGLSLIGVAISVILADQGATARTFVAIWVVLAILILALLGLSSLIPSVRVGG